jgi:DNA-binding CsgD family transcriptional regulator
MLGRAREASLVESLVGGARGGTSGSLLISGEPGIGKTALLAHARAAAHGTVVLEASGAEGESHLAFAGLHDLLGPVLGELDALPGPQAAALRGALALGPPRPGDRFTTYAATLSLLAAAAEERPVTCIVDDAHWLDAESFEAVQFASRRLGAEGVAVLMAARDGLSPRVDAWPLQRLRLDGLGGADARALIAENAPVAPSPEVLDAVLAGARGNPLALIELAGSLTPDQLAGTEPLPDPLPVGPYLQEALLRPVRALPETTRRALLVVSADDGTTGFLPAALAAEGLAMADLEPAERARVIAVGPTRALFSHPLVRAAVYGSADAVGRRSAHQAHAASASAVGESALDRRAWHLALAATGPDEAVAADLEAAAGRAAGRNGHAAACEALETAARLSPEAVERGRRFVAAGQSAMAAGDFARAGRLFDEVMAQAVDPAQAFEAMIGRCYVETFAGSTRRAIDLLVAAADRAAVAAPPAAATLLVQAAFPAVMRTDLIRANALVSRARQLADGGPPDVVALVEVCAAGVSTIGSRPVRPAPERVAEVDRQAGAGNPAAMAWSIASVQALVLMEHYQEVAARLDELVAAGRERSAPLLLTWPLSMRADLLRRTGELDEAAADGTEALALAEDTGQDPQAGFVRWTLAMIHAARGESAECRAHTDEMRVEAARSDAESLVTYADSALGFLAPALGELATAREHLQSAAQGHAAVRLAPHPLLDMHRPDLVETLIRLGDPARAAEVLEALEDQAVDTGATWPAAAAARCRGLLAAEDAFEERFAAALDLHARTPTPFERARTELCLGERRRRARRSREAREPLERALETFDALGATPWADWARRELRAAGARPRPARPQSAVALTPQEMQVALAVSEGATNKEVAAALLLSPKTIEYHLGKVYEKLGVRSRAELARRMAREGVSPAGTAAAD